jgi:hypothetical protein
VKPVQESSSIFWQTPAALIESLTEEFGSLFDPCPKDPDFDGLAIPWPMGEAIFVNPPYARGEIAQWVLKCFQEWEARGQTIILLIPPYTDTAYFHDYILPWCDVRFIRGRLKFKCGKRGRPGPAPFPSILCVYPGAQLSDFRGSNDE